MKVISSFGIFETMMVVTYCYLEKKLQSFEIQRKFHYFQIKSPSFK